MNHKLTRKHRRETNFCTALYSLHIRDVNGVQTVTLNVYNTAKKYNSILSLQTSGIATQGGITAKKTRTLNIELAYRSFVESKCFYVFCNMDRLVEFHKITKRQSLWITYPALINHLTGSRRLQRIN